MFAGLLCSSSKMVENALASSPLDAQVYTHTLEARLELSNMFARILQELLPIHLTLS